MFGTSLALAQVLILGLIIGAFSFGTPVTLAGLVLGSLMVAGFGLLVGAFGRDFLDTLVLAMLVMIPLLVPAFAAMLPGSAPAWVQALPTYGLVRIIVEAPEGAMPADLVAPATALVVWTAAAFRAGIWVLNRRVSRP